MMAADAVGVEMASTAAAAVVVVAVMALVAVDYEVVVVVIVVAVNDHKEHLALMADHELPLAVVDGVNARVVVEMVEEYLAVMFQIVVVELAAVVAVSMGVDSDPLVIQAAVLAVLLVVRRAHWLVVVADCTLHVLPALVAALAV